MTRRSVTPDDQQPDWEPVHEDASFFGLEQDAVKHQQRVDSSEKFARIATNWMLGIIIAFLCVVAVVLGSKFVLWLVSL